jgi:hypothetical protein
MQVIWRGTDGHEHACLEPNFRGVGFWVGHIARSLIGLVYKRALGPNFKTLTHQTPIPLAQCGSTTR